MFPLHVAPVNTKLKVMKAGSNPGMSKRLESLGLGEGSIFFAIEIGRG